jgi:hypothetical protein
MARRRAGHGSRAMFCSAPDASRRLVMNFDVAEIERERSGPGGVS